jgi:hypothetical protein
MDLAAVRLRDTDDTVGAIARSPGYTSEYAFAQQTRERVLHDVFGGAEVTEHPEGQVDQVRAVFPVSLADRCVVLFPRHTASSRRSAGRHQGAALAM